MHPEIGTPSTPNRGTLQQPDQEEQSPGAPARSATAAPRNQSTKSIHPSIQQKRGRARIAHPIRRIGRSGWLVGWGESKKRGAEQSRDI